MTNGYTLRGQSNLQICPVWENLEAENAQSINEIKYVSLTKKAIKKNAIQNYKMILKCKTVSSCIFLFLL